MYPFKKPELRTFLLYACHTSLCVWGEQQASLGGAGAQLRPNPTRPRERRAVGAVRVACFHTKMRHSYVVSSDIATSSDPDCAA